MATGTYTPFVPQQYFDNSGNPLVSGTIETFIAGTTTHAATYSDVNLTTPNANPMTLDSGGRPPAGAIFLVPGSSYKFLVKDSTGAMMATPDNISAVPASSATVDVTGTAGEMLSAGSPVYLSDGSGGKTVGLWYKGDSTNTYSSNLPFWVGVVPATIASAASGTVRLIGVVSGLSSLTVGATVYIGASGALTTTAPNNTRAIGVADTTTSLIVGPPPVPLDNSINDFRLTLTSGTPVTTADVTAATTLYCTPSGKGNRIALYTATGAMNLRISGEFSIAVPATTSQVYDIFCYDNAGVPTLELLAWTNDTTRATAIVLTTTGTYTKFGDLTRRYLASFRTTAVSGQTEDSETKRFLWNYYNRARRSLFRIDGTPSWTYTLATWRQANGATANKVEMVIGVADVLADIKVQVQANNTGGSAIAVGLGIDSITVPSTRQIGGPIIPVAAGASPAWAALNSYLAVGYHYLAWLEWSTASGTTTWFGDNVINDNSGLSGFIDG